METCSNAPKKTNPSIRYRKRLRQLVIQRLGGKCACCGDEHFEFLVVDHVLGGGTKYRSQVVDTLTIYRLVRDGGYDRTKYRILCHNCNSALGIYGYCPHQRQQVIQQFASLGE